MIPLTAHNRRQEKWAIVPTHKPFALTIACGNVDSTRFRQTLIDDLRNSPGDIRISERREFSFGVIGRSRNNLRQPLSQCLTDLFRMTRSPYSGSVNTRAATVVEDGRDHYINVVFPPVNTVLPDHDLAVTWAMDLDS